MPENIIFLVDKIRAVRGQEYANGMVDMANLLVPNATPQEKQNEVGKNKQKTDPHNWDGYKKETSK